MNIYASSGLWTLNSVYKISRLMLLIVQDNRCSKKGDSTVHETRY